MIAELQAGLLSLRDRLRGTRVFGFLASRRPGPYRRRKTSSLVGNIIVVQVAITAAIGLFSLGGVAWTSQAITEKNLERWAKQWGSQLNELGAPLYASDTNSRILSIERFVAAYPEVTQVDWYSPAGLQLFSVTQSGYTPTESRKVLPQNLIRSLNAEDAAVEPRLVPPAETESGHYRLIGSIWSESFAGDALMRLGSDPEPATVKQIEGIVAVELDYSWYQEVFASRLALGSLALLALLAISTACGKYILERALKPLSRLQAPLSRLAAGDMEVQFDPSPHKEIQNIIHALDNTTRALGERDRRLSHLATHDSLTELLNRHAFVQELEQEIERIGRTGGHSAVLFVDLDQFKYINDTCGHPAGDELLRIAARCIKATVRDDDIVARFGGDEFSVLARNVTRTAARRIGEKILKNMAMLTQVHDKKVFHLQCSIGIAMVGRSPLDAHEYLSRADVACHAAKENGRNRVEVYRVSRKETQQMAKEIAWVQRMRKALDDNSFVLVYQPLLRIDTGWTDHYEVLLRLRNDDGDLVSPEAYLPAATRFGLMSTIDFWVVEHAIRSLAEHRNPRTRVNYSINLSTSVFEDDRFSRHVESLLERYDVEPDAIIFEITEQAAVQFAAEFDRHIVSLRNLGCRFAIDDFGKGYSSFSYLRRLSVDYLKIDGSFVIGLDRDEVNQTLIRVMGEVARAVGMETIAECVENARTLELLAELGIDYAQGYFIAPPSDRPVEVEMPATRRRAAGRRTVKST